MVTLRMSLVLGFAGSLIVARAAHGRSPAAAACEGLSTRPLPHMTVTRAQLVPAGQFSGRAAGILAPGEQGFRPYTMLPAFCRFAATLAPSSDSEIKIEVWMPAENWNGKLEALGNGGWAGQLSVQALAGGVARGYATATTDTGHAGGSGAFAFGHPEKLVDFAYRAVHDMTTTAKAVMQAFYGTTPTRSYWVGCSTGGRQGLKEAQHYPDDYDAIVAGAPANDMTHLMFSSIWVAQASHRDPASYIPPAKYPVIHRAVLAACDANDGVTDGVIDDPRTCAFDPGTIQCAAGDETTCLTAKQVETVRAIYAGARNPHTHAVVYPGLERGSEMGWSGLAGPTPLTIADDYFKYILFKDPNWDYQSLNFETDVVRADALDHGDMNAVDPNLAAFFNRGGKLLMYHGWNDQLIAPENSINYYESVAKAMGGAARIDASIRLFMMPGVTHCGGGDGPGTFDALGVIERWVEQQRPPAAIVAAHLTAGAADRTRPLCPYPQVAVYSGTGDTNVAASFACKRPGR